MPPATKKKPAEALYYGFSPEQTYVIRSRVRAYNGTTERFVFSNGQAVAYPMRDDATEEQKIARGERLGRLSSDRTYRIFVYGEEPPANADPAWRGQIDPAADSAGEDTGEDTHLWQQAAKPPVQMPVEGATPAGRTSNELRDALPKSDQDTGERRPAAPSGPAAPPPQPQWNRTNEPGD